MYDHRHSSLLVLHYLISSLLLRTHVNDGNHLREERDRPAAGQKDTGLDRRKDATRPYAAHVEAALHRQQAQRHPFGEGVQVAEHDGGCTELFTGNGGRGVIQGEIIVNGDDGQVDGTIEEVAEAEVEQQQRVGLQGDGRRYSAPPPAPKKGFLVPSDALCQTQLMCPCGQSEEVACAP